MVAKSHWTQQKQPSTSTHMPAKQDTWVQSLEKEDSLEKEMATHSSTFAWEIPWTDEPGGGESREGAKSWT